MRRLDRDASPMRIILRVAVHDGMRCVVSQIWDEEFSLVITNSDASDLLPVGRVGRVDR